MNVDEKRRSSKNPHESYIHKHPPNSPQCMRREKLRSTLKLYIKFIFFGSGKSLKEILRDDDDDGGGRRGWRKFSFSFYAN